MTGQNFKVAHEGALLQYLFEILPGQSRTGVKNLLSKGQVLVNGEGQTAFDLPLKKGDTITILPKGISIARAVKSDAKDEVLKAGVKILFEDENYIVVDKPSGMLTVSTGKEKKTLYALLNAYIKVNARMQRKEDLISGKTPDRSTAKIWIVHRLDKGTSGALVFAKNERAKDILQSRWKDLVAERKYVAWLEGKVEKESGAIQTWLVENPKSLKMNSFDTEVKDGQLAITHYRVLGYSRRYTQVEFSLETGRKNQIRVHAASLGHPVAGDDKYGAETDPIKRLALHAATLVFRNPFSNKMVRCSSPLPESFERFTAK
ncbi:MAG: RluA family pseudouridine synthase [Bacteroidales bacterium]|jgi:23S rRNA pseudouridine1911/1915/1917 synthase|nr:RluA family pseudouridine synthase [Bacteroidales bacterium]